MSLPLSLPLILLVALLTLLIPTYAISGVDDVCVSACSDWSVVMGFCRGNYNDYSQQVSIDYTNAFLGCLCLGSTSTGEMGNSTIGISAGTCLSCKTTPGKIKKDLVMFLSLCSVQASNGTATNATAFMPISYTTSEDTSMNAEGKKNGASPRLSSFLPLLIPGGGAERDLASYVASVVLGLGGLGLGMLF